MSFFIRKNVKRKRFAFLEKSQEARKIKKSEDKLNDVEIGSETDDDEEEDRYVSPLKEPEFRTVQDHKVYLAKKYLKEVEIQEKEKLQDEEADVRTNVIKRLTEEELQKAGKLKRKLADILRLDTNAIKQLKCKQHKLSVTCVAVSHDNRFLYSSSKDAAIVKWSLTDFTKLCFVAPKCRKKSVPKDPSDHSHRANVTCLAVSADDKYLASGDEEGLINIWNCSDLSYVDTFKGHRGAITGLAICKGTNTLYSISNDSLVKVWTLNELSYVETLFGHQKNATSVDVLFEERIVSSGGSDHTVRVWKIQEESQLIFNGPPDESIDIVKRIDNNHFVSGGDKGVLSVWGVMKKKPLFSANAAHGTSQQNGEPNWITSICTLQNSDLIVSGSCDGFVRFWKCPDNFRTLHPVCSLPISGFVNTIVFTPDEKYMIIGVGKEHKFGRWSSINDAKNSIVCIPLSKI